MGKKYILLLGGCGFIGTHLSALLLKNNFSLICYDINQGNSPEFINNFPNQYIYIEGNLSNTNLIKEEILSKFEITIVIHLSSTIVPGETFNKLVSDLTLNLNPTIQLIQNMQDYGMNKIVFFSSGGTVYGDNETKINTESSQTKPINFYGWLKLTIENYILMCHKYFDIKYLILRPSNPYGILINKNKNQGFIPIALDKAINGKEIEIWGDGTIIRDYIHIDDLTKLVLELINNNIWNETINIGSGIGTSINSVLKIISEITGKKLLTKYLESRKVDIPVNILDIYKIKKLTGISPTINLHEGIKMTYLKMCSSIIP